MEFRGLTGGGRAPADPEPARSGDGRALALFSQASLASLGIAAHIWPIAVEISPNVAFGRFSLSPGRFSLAKSWYPDSRFRSFTLGAAFTPL